MRGDLVIVRAFRGVPLVRRIWEEVERGRSLWPTAPLPCLADDGKAVALLLADLARRDHLAGIDRAAACYTVWTANNKIVSMP